MIQLAVERYTDDGGEGRTLGPFAFIGVDGPTLTNEYEEPIAALEHGQWHTSDDGKAWDNLLIESVSKGVSVNQTVGTVESGSSVVGAKIDFLG